jgi:hypothetical protein
VRRGRALLASVVGVGVLMLPACRAQSGTQPTIGPGDCANVALFRGETYRGGNAVVIPSPGTDLGDLRVQVCGGQLPDQIVRVGSLPGIDPADAVVSIEDPEIVYVREDLSLLAPPVRRYFVAPVCDPKDAPIELRGTWLGIAQPDGTTELDLRPPYDVTMLVRDASAATYLSAELSIRVAPELGAPLTHDDVASSLWNGGDLDVVAACRGDRFVARSVTASAA